MRLALRVFCGLFWGVMCVALSGVFSRPALAARNNCGALFAGSIDVVEKRIQTGLLDVSGRLSYYEHIPARNGKPTAVVFTGLFTPIDEFRDLQIEFMKRAKGEGLLIYTYSTSADSLVAGSYYPEKKYAEKVGVSLEDLATEAMAIAHQVGATQRLAIVGYSYGAAPALEFLRLYPSIVENLVFVSPLVFPGDDNPQAAMGQAALAAMAMLNPFAGGLFMSNLQKTAIHTKAELIFQFNMANDKLPNGLSKNQIVAGLESQIAAAQDHDLRSADVASWPKTSFLLAGGELPARLKLQQEIVVKTQSIPKVSGETVIVPDADHRLLQLHPVPSAEALLAIMRP